MEAAGIALAVLPLAINQLDAYVQGLETIKSFGAKRYRRELEGYSSSLGTQQAIFVNTLERTLDGVVEYEDGLDELRSNPLGSMWERENLRASLRDKLGRDFEPFNQTMTDLANLLEELSRKLGLDKNAAMKSPSNPSAFYNTDQPSGSIYHQKEIKKFKDIFSKSIYLDLFARIDAANRILKTLVEQSDYRATIQKRIISKRPLLRQKRVRKSAVSLHNAIMRGKYWKCACQDQRSIQFVLDYPGENLNGFEDNRSRGCRFRMISPSNNLVDLVDGWGGGVEIEAESNAIQPSVNILDKSSFQGSSDGLISTKRKNRVQFMVDELSEDELSMSEISSSSPIMDICSALSTVMTDDETNKAIGFISDEIYRHNMYYVRNLAGNSRSQSLAELIAASSDIFRMPSVNRFLFTWGHRLRVAVNLACSVLSNFTVSGDIEKPFVLCNVGRDPDSWSMCKDNSTFSLIQSDILFPLGLVLIELSLCQTLEALRMPEDDDNVEADMNLKTATRLLPVVGAQSGAE
ncbi:hypothetical protein N7488_011229 [Penicillium malachiteum]|nr:hypothetical protein N7488_011229 [Penicillium malachiteum]